MNSELSRRTLLGLAGSGLLLSSLNCLPEKKSKERKKSQFIDESRLQKKFDESIFRIENKLGPSPMAVEATKEVSENWHSYSLQMDLQDQLEELLSERHSVDKENLRIKPGSRILLLEAMTRHTRKKNRIVFSLPEYITAYYYAYVLKAKTIKIPVKKDLSANLEVMAKNAKSAGFVYLSNPNLPYNHFFDRDRIEHFIKACSPTPIYIDEAYIQFLGEGFEGQSCIGLTAKYPNLIVSRTFSKAYGLAGYRLGYTACSDEKSRTMALFDREVHPMATAAGLGAIKDDVFLQKTRSYVAKTKEKMKKLLEERDLNYLMGPSNFCTLRSNNLTKKQIKRLFEEFQFYFTDAERGWFYHLIPITTHPKMLEHLDRIAAAKNS